MSRRVGSARAAKTRDSVSAVIVWVVTGPPPVSTLWLKLYGRPLRFFVSTLWLKVLFGEGRAARGELGGDDAPAGLAVGGAIMTGYGFFR